MITYLLGRASTGKFRFVVVESDEEWHEPEHGYIIQRSYGQVYGKTTLSPAIIVNKTKQKRTWKEQLELQYNSEVKKFKDKGYIEVSKHPDEYTNEELSKLFGEVVTNQVGVIKPMLAKQESKLTNRKILDKRWLCSKKLDGVRCLMYYKDGDIYTASRGGESYHYSTEHLRKNPFLIDFFKENPTIILDGELYKHGKTLQQLSGAARMEKNAYDCLWLQYWIYDMYDTSNPDLIAEDRQKFLSEKLLWIDNSSLEDDFHLVEQIEVSKEDNIWKLHDQYVSEGFEGCVIRDPSRPYKPNGRTNDMIKFKRYLDDTYRIIGYELGLRGSEDMVFICELKDGKTFKASPIGDRETKQEYVDNFEEKYKNHLGDCTYFTLSDTGIPTQPKFRTWRFDLE